jgi:molecular chaperone GrpE
MSDDREEKKNDETPDAEPATAEPKEEKAAAPAAEAVPPEGTTQAPDSAPDGEGEGGPEKASPRKHRKHDHDPARALKDKLERREQEIESLRRENADLKDRYLRAAAEMDNTRKRIEREKADFIQFAQAELFKELLAVLDNFERARRTGEEPEAKGFQEGIDLIHKQFTDLLRKRGVSPVERADRRFDPAVHQAILTEEKEGLAEAEVGEELQKGYFLHDRLLRPALVKVWLPKKD